MTCPDCGQPMTGVQYAYDQLEHYDGVSEWVCTQPFGCGLRLGRWTRRRLRGTDVEPRYGGNVRRRAVRRA